MRILAGEATSKCRTVDVCDIFGDNSGIALYRLDGNANDESGNYHGTETAVTYGGGVYERGVVFNGTSSVIALGSTIDNPLRTAGAFTVSAWVHPTAYATDNSMIVSLLDDIYLRFYLDASGNLVAYIISATSVASVPTDTAPIGLDIWTHVVVTGDSTGIRMYKDVTQVGTTITWDGTFYTYTNTLYKANRMGADLNNGATRNEFIGSIDQVRIFNRAITATEVATLYAECAPTSTVDNINPFEDGSLKALYQFNGDATDKTGVYNGAATNVTYGTGKFGQCAVFNGSALVSTSFALSANVFSYSGWFKVTTPSSTIQSLIDFTTNRAMLSSGNGTDAYVSYYDGGTYRTFSTYTLPANTFVFLSLVVNGTTAYLYADGVLKGTSACTAIIPSGGMYLGRYAGSASGFLTGSQDQVRVFNKALTPMEVASLYNETTPLEEPMHSLVDPFKDFSGKTLYRLDGNTLDESGKYNSTASSLTYGTGQFGRCGVFNGTSNYVSMQSNITELTTVALSLNVWIKIAVAPSTSATILQVNYNAGGAGSTVNSGAALVLNSDRTFRGVYIMLNNETYLGTDGVALTNYSANAFSFNVMNIGEWYMVTAVINGNTMSIYTNGVLEGTITTVQSIRFGSSTRFNAIGFNDVSNTGYVNGSIDQVRTFNKALTATEVLKLYEGENNVV